MASLDSLPADQKAVVQLLLSQGRSYEQIAGLLKIGPEAVRARAHGALAALGPDDSGLTAERRDEIADFLLGQLDDGHEIATRVFLAGSASGRAWARVVAGELRPVAGDALPEIPEGAEPAAPKAPPAQPPAPAAPAAAGPAAGHETPHLGSETSTPIPGPRSSRRGGILLLSGAALVIAIVLLLVLVVFSGGGSKKKTASTTTPAKNAASTSGANVVGQANLLPPGAKTPGKRLGVVQIVEQSGQLRIRAVAQGLPAPPKNAGWGVWFTAPGSAQWLGYFQVVTKQGQALAEGALNVDPTKFKTVLITAEKGKNPTKPGTAVLEGPIQFRSATGG